MNTANRVCFLTLMIGTAFASWASAGAPSFAVSFPEQISRWSELGFSQLTPSGCCSERSDEWEEAGFGKVRKIQIGDSDFPSAPQQTHEIAPKVIVFRNSGWSPDEIKFRYVKFAKVFSQCGIRVRAPLIIEADAPGGVLDFDADGFEADAKFQIAASTPIVGKPVAYYVRSLIGGEKTERTVGLAGAKSRTGEDSPLADTLWISSIAKQSEASAFPPSFSVEAHEFGHLLTNGGHADGKANFLSDTADLMNDKITREQCERMLQHESVSKIQGDVK